MDNSLAVRENEIRARVLAIIKKRLSGETQRYIAKASGMTEANVSLILRGLTPLTFESISRLCEVANVNVWKVFKEAEAAK